MRKKSTEILDFFVVSLLGVFSIGYSSIYTRNFAQLHVQFPFLDFPVFIGELLFALCLFLFFLKWAWGGIKIEGKDLYLWGLLGLYCLFVVVKAVYGYIHHGPLALRNAALFYYPIFAVFAAVFYNPKYFNKMTIPIILFLLMGSVLLRPLNCYSYFMFSYVILTLVLILQFKSLSVRIGLIVMLILFSPVLGFFMSSRAHMIASLLGAVVIVAFYLIIKMRKARIHGGFYFFAFLCLAVLLVKTFARREELSSFTSIKRNIEQIRQVNLRIAEAKKNYTPKEIPVAVYQEEVIPEPFPSPEKIIESDTLIMVEKIQKAAAPIPTPTPFPAPPPISNPVMATPLASSPVPTPTPPAQGLDPEPVNNAIWRLLVWRDMLEEVHSTHPIGGVDFGKPFRSPSIEIMGWNRKEIYGVGWLEPHNSYVHVIYRAGVLGILFILVLFLLVFRMAVRFVKGRSIAGVLLIASMAYWFIVANFLVCFELPFFAIPLWSLFGLTFAYSNQNKSDR
jgi:hypothetical protein